MPTLKLLLKYLGLLLMLAAVAALGQSLWQFVYHDAFHLLTTAQLLDDWVPHVLAQLPNTVRSLLNYNAFISLMLLGVVLVFFGTRPSKPKKRFFK